MQPHSPPANHATCCQASSGHHPPRHVREDLIDVACVQVQSRRERLEEGVRRQMRVPVAAWGVREVCDWAEHIGLGQYRKRFLHHCIGGALLLELTEHNLKVGTSHILFTHGHMCNPLVAFH